MKKRLWASCLTVAILLGLLPTAALSAALTDTEAQSGLPSALTEGGTYWFDLSAAGLPSTVNTGGTNGGSSPYSGVPDTTLHYVPFTYAGKVNAYKWTDAQTMTEAYDHSLFIADYAVTHGGADGKMNWTALNALGLIFGKSYESGGVGYTLRAPSTGRAGKTPAAQLNNPSYFYDKTDRGLPENNEWDSILDKNESWIKNWENINAAWGQDIANDGTHRVTRGYYTVRRCYYIWNGSNEGFSGLGYRPVLEIPTTLRPDDLSVVALNLNEGYVGTSETKETGDADGNIYLVVKSGQSYTAPSETGLTAPTGKLFACWSDGANEYQPGEEVPAAVSSLTAVWKADILTEGATYWFDLSAVGLPITANTGGSWSDQSVFRGVPDPTLHYVPFTYTGRVNAYKWADAQTMTEAYDHSLFIADYAVTHAGADGKMNWTALNSLGLIFGKDYESGGVGYTLRAPSVGRLGTIPSAQLTNPSYVYNKADRGYPNNNEWDSVLDKNESWIKNNENMNAWGQDIAMNGSHRVTRGYYTTRYCHYAWNPSNEGFLGAGYRPVLEIPTTLRPDDLSIVALNLNEGFVGTGETKETGDADGNIYLVMKSGQSYTAPSGVGLTAPAGKFFVCWSDGTNEYRPGEKVPAAVSELTAVWEADTLTEGATYWFDLSAAGLPSTVNTGGSWADQTAFKGVPDPTLHYVPFIYTGKVNAYKWTDAQTMTEAYDHSLFIADYIVTHGGVDGKMNWTALNALGLIFGKDYESGGVGYTLRAPSTGCVGKSPAAQLHDPTYRYDKTDRGFPINNEWDSILNKNESWIKNYENINTWGQDISIYGDYRITRGVYTTRYCYYIWNPSNEGFLGVGYRPVLEIPATLASSALKTVSLDLNGGKVSTSTEAGPLNYVVAASGTFPAPAGEGLTAPSGKVFAGWLDSDNKLYKSGAPVPSTVTGLTAYWATLPAVTAPTDQTVTEGETATFEVTTDSTDAHLAYQWQESVDGAAWTDISGAASASYTISKTTLDMTGKQYRCLVSVGEAQAVSTAATLTVNKGEPFPNLTPGGTYWFDLSLLKEKNIGTVNTGTEEPTNNIWLGISIPGAASVPDDTLHWVPFTYTGIIDAYVLNSNSIGVKGAAVAASTATTEGGYGYTYPHSLFISDYNLFHAVSWTELNRARLIFGDGAPYTGGNVSYILRAPTGGSGAASATTVDGVYKGAAPGNNEWDTILGKNADWIKNWTGEWSWGQDTISDNSSRRILRGLYVSVDTYGYWDATYKGVEVAYRPVLEIPTDAALSVVTLNLNGGKAGNTGTAQSGPINLVVKSNTAYTAPTGEGLTTPSGKVFAGWKGTDDNVYNAGDAVPAAVDQLTAAWITPPTVREGLVYNAEAQLLVTAGSAENGCTLEYSTDGTTYAAALPAGTNAGEYTVAYRVTASGTGKVLLTDSLTVTISKAANSITNLTCADIACGGTPAPSATAAFGTPTFSYSSTESGTYGEWNTANAAGTWYVKAGVAGTDNYESAELTGSFNVTRVIPGITAPTARTLTYTGSAQALVTAGSTTGGTMMYSTDGTNYSAAIPTGTNAGNYTVWYKVVGDGNHSDIAPASLTVTISKAANSITNLTCADIACGGTPAPSATAAFGTPTFSYGSTESGTYGEWNTANVAGIWYVKASVSGTDNYESAELTGSFNVTRVIPGITAPTARTLTYTDSAQALVTAGSTTGGSMEYSTDGTNYSAAIPTGTNAGNYTVWYKVVGDGNHSDTAPASLTVTISKASNSITGLTCADIACGGTPTPSATAAFGTPTFSYSSTESGTYGEWNTANVAGIWYVKAGVAGTDNYESAELTGSFNVTRVTPGITAPTARILTYTGSAQALINAGSSTDGTMMYSLEENGLYSGMIPEGTDAGNYTVWYKVVGDGNHSDLKSHITVTIGKAANGITGLACADITYGEVPAPSAGADFGVTAFAYSSAEGGTYGDWSVANTAGTWYVKASVVGTDNYESAEAVVTFAVRGAPQAAPAAPEEESTTTDCVTLKAVADSPNGGKAQYSKDGGVTWQYSPIFTGLSAGTKYTFAVRYGAVGSYEPSPISPTVEITTQQPPIYTVTFDSQGGTAVAAGSVTQGERLTKPADPTREGWSFSGWYKDPDCTTAWSFESESVTGAMTLYAKWTAFTMTTPGDGGGAVTITPKTYPPIIEWEPREAGTVTAEPTEPARGDTVTITVTTQEGFELEELTATDDKGQTVELTAKQDGTFSFIQPRGPVTIRGIYKAVEVPETEGAWENVFEDVTEDDWYWPAVEYVARKGYFNGVTKTTFAPKLNTTRAMMVTVFYRAAGEVDVPEVTWGEEYNDVQRNAYYTEAVYWARLNGVAEGYGKGLFGPKDMITREQMAAILYRYDGSPEISNMRTDFSDMVIASEYAKPALHWAVDQGIMIGRGKGILDPKGYATRAEVATMLKRYFESKQQ